MFFLNCNLINAFVAGGSQRGHLQVVIVGGSLFENLNVSVVTGPKCIWGPSSHTHTCSLTTGLYYYYMYLIKYLNSQYLKFLL